MFHVKQFRMSNYKHILTTKDFLVTGDTFEISKNLETGILETLPKPNQSDLHKYYDSKNYISHNQKPSSFFSKTFLPGCPTMSPIARIFNSI